MGREPGLAAEQRELQAELRADHLRVGVLGVRVRIEILLQQPAVGAAEEHAALVPDRHAFRVEVAVEEQALARPPERILDLAEREVRTRHEGPVRVGEVDADALARRRAVEGDVRRPRIVRRITGELQHDLGGVRDLRVEPEARAEARTILVGRILDLAVGDALLLDVLVPHAQVALELDLGRPVGALDLADLVRRDRTLLAQFLGLRLEVVDFGLAAIDDRLELLVLGLQLGV